MSWWWRRDESCRCGEEKSPVVVEERPCPGEKSPVVVEKRNVLVDVMEKRRVVEKRRVLGDVMEG